MNASLKSTRRQPEAPRGAVADPLLGHWRGNMGDHPSSSPAPLGSTSGRGRQPERDVQCDTERGNQRTLIGSGTIYLGRERGPEEGGELPGLGLRQLNISVAEDVVALRSVGLSLLVSSSHQVIQQNRSAGCSPALLFS